MKFMFFKIQVLSFLVFLAALEAETKSITIGNVMIECKSFDHRSCEDTEILGFNDAGQLLFTDHPYCETLFLLDTKTDTVDNLYDQIDPDEYVYCPTGGQCLSVEGDVVGLMNKSLGKWNKDTGWERYPIPKDAGKQVKNLECLGSGKVLLEFDAEYSGDLNYYLFDNGSFSKFSSRLKSELFPDYKNSSSLSSFCSNASGHAAGILRPNYYPSSDENFKLFQWNGKDLRFLSMGSLFKSQKSSLNNVHVVRLFNDDTVLIKYQDYKSEFHPIPLTKYAFWNSKDEVDVLLGAYDVSSASFNNKGTGIYRDRSTIIFKGQQYQIADLLPYSDSYLEEDEDYDYYHDCWSFTGDASEIYVNENDEIAFVYDDGFSSYPVVISIREIVE